jgi:hypothetical protein
LPPAAAGRFGEIVPLVDTNGKVYARGRRRAPDSSMAGLAKLKPFFDRKYGRVTPGNSSQITDGAAWLILASAGGGRQVASSSRSARSPTANGPASTRRRWALARCMRRRRSCSATAWRSTTSTSGKSTKPSPRRCWAASPPGNRTTTAASSSDLPARSARCRRRAQRRWRRDCARPPGRRVGRAHRPAPAAGAARGQGKARHRHDLHRRWSGRRDAGGGSAEHRQDGEKA